MLTEMPEQLETRAIAVASLTLVQSLLATLAKENVLTTGQITQLFQTASQSLAAFPQPDAGATNAKTLVDGIAKVVSQHLRYL
jgi:hypothetical protein